MTTTTFDQTIATSYTERVSKPSVVTKFIDWSNAQNGDRLLWLGVIVTVHGCVLTPLTLMAVYFGGTSFTLFMLAFIAMGMALVTNLAAMPTKYTIPVFALSVLIDLGIIISSIFLASM